MKRTSKMKTTYKMKKMYLARAYTTLVVLVTQHTHTICTSNIYEQSKILVLTRTTKIKANYVHASKTASCCSCQYMLTLNL